MKGMIKYLSPFAPDQSGAVSALYGMDGLLVICDAGGCTGNVCGFDEPRWFQERKAGKNAIFSAGLRDMDAILGRDERLVEKLADAADHLEASFAALIGTPVPAVIATDLYALAHMAEEKTGLPVLTVECTGTRLYDEGERDAWTELFRNFAGCETGGEDDGFLGVIGCTPLDISRVEADTALNRYAQTQGYTKAYCYGMGAGLEKVRRSGDASKNLVLTPAGIAPAKYLKKTFGTPYETGFPLFGKEFRERMRDLDGKRVLVIHQQVAANEIRNLIVGAGSDEAVPSQGDRQDKNIVCGTWFMQIPELSQPQDVRFEREDEFISFVEKGNFDVIIGDRKLRRALHGWSGEYIDCPHFAVSGNLTEE